MDRVFQSTQAHLDLISQQSNLLPMKKNEFFDLVILLI